MSKSDNELAKLSESAIKNTMLSRLSGAVDVTVLDSVGSTNTWLKDRATHNTASDVLMHVCAAEQQTQGRGRRGKTWHSPKQGVTFSVAFTVAHPACELSGFSLLCGVALCDVLHEIGVVNPMVKWPNDVLVDGAKLSGILVETTLLCEHTSTVIVGIGINYRRGSEASQIDQLNTDLFALTGNQIPDRSALIGSVAARVYTNCQGSVPHGVGQLAERWDQYDALAGTAVEFDSGGRTQSGVVCGLDATGRLRVRTASGQTTVASGQVSVRRLPSQGR